MELTLADVAGRHACTVRTVQLAVQEGQLSAWRRVGRALVVDDLAAQAWSRSASRGRRWTARARDAALDLLSTGTTTAMSGSDRSRLRGRLRAMTIPQVAYASGGLGAWGRYDAGADVDVVAIGPSAVSMSELGVLAGAGWLTFGQVDDLDAFELDSDVRPSANGSLGVVERECRDDRPARILLDTYLLGDARTSAAAAARLEDMARAL